MSFLVDDEGLLFASSTTPLRLEQSDIILLLLGHKRMVAPFVDFNASPSFFLWHSFTVPLICI